MGSLATCVGKEIVRHSSGRHDYHYSLRVVGVWSWSSGLLTDSSIVQRSRVGQKYKQFECRGHTFNSSALTIRCTTSGTVDPSGPIPTPLPSPLCRSLADMGVLASPRQRPRCNRASAPGSWKLRSAPPRRSADSTARDIRAKATAALGSTARL